MNTVHTIDDSTIIFQTHRLYNSNGQIIIAKEVLPRVIQFEDVSRMIRGTIRDCSLDAREILNRYDSSQYDTTLDYTLSTELRELFMEYKDNIPLD